MTQMALPGVAVARSVQAADKFAGTLSPTDKRQTRETRICIGQNLTRRGHCGQKLTGSLVNCGGWPSQFR